VKRGQHARVGREAREEARRFKHISAGMDGGNFRCAENARARGATPAGPEVGKSCVSLSC